LLIINLAARSIALGELRDDRYALLDLLQTHVWLWLSIRAAQSGAVDISGELARYQELIADHASTEPFPFPPPEKETPP